MFFFLSFGQFKLLFRYCALAFMGNLIYFLLYRVDYFFVERYCSASQLGNYIQVSKLAHLFFILPTILAAVILPVTAGGKQANIGNLLAMLSRTIFLIYLTICSLLALTVSWLFQFVFGKSFTAMYQPFLLLIPGILALSSIFTITAYFAGSNRIKINIIGSVYALLFILFGNMIFTPLFGINAAALISSIGYIVYQVYIIGVLKKEFKLPLSDFFIFKFTDIKKIGAGINDTIKNK